MLGQIYLRRVSKGSYRSSSFLKQTTVIPDKTATPPIADCNRNLVEVSDFGGRLDTAFLQ
jgi:hypothetical protein